MADKQKVKPSDTYVLEEEDIEQLDDLTLTSVIRDAAELPEPEPLEDESPNVDDFDFDVLSPKK